MLTVINSVYLINLYFFQIVKEQPNNKIHGETRIGALGAEFRRSAGGANRDRTGDLLLAKQVLSQLSYIPTGRALSAVHQGLGAHRSFGWWAFLVSNQGPHAYQACALTS